jgi:hypothetical protein
VKCSFGQYSQDSFFVVLQNALREDYVELDEESALGL